MKELFNVLNDFTEKCYPELDHAELYEQWEETQKEKLQEIAR